MRRGSPTTLGAPGPAPLEAKNRHGESREESSRAPRRPARVETSDLADAMREVARELAALRTGQSEVIAELRAIRRALVQEADER